MKKTMMYIIYILCNLERKSEKGQIKGAKQHALRKSPVVCAATSSSKERL